MFSPEASLQGTRGSLRNPRRRQRKDSDGPQQPRRKRSKLSEGTFNSTTDAHANGNGSALMNGHASHGHGPASVDSSLVLVDMPVREKKTLVKRAPKDDTASYLTKNDHYAVKKLPGFPQSLSRAKTPFRASALPSAGLALALTTDRALVWEYTSIAGAAKVLTLPLPFGLKASDPLPIGAVVRNGPTNDFGIVAIAPTNGKITFWENVETAEAHSHFPQRQQGVHGSLRLYSGETITDLVDVEHAGYVLILSSGRLAQLTLRDSQGRPSIATSILNAPNGSNGSFFSFKGLLGATIRKTIASVRAHPSKSKGQMEVVTATRSGVFQVWDLSWSGQQIFKRELDVHAAALATVQEGTAPETRGQHDIHILDFAILDQQHVEGSIPMLVLVALSGRNTLDYSLLEVDLLDSSGAVRRAIPIRNFQQTQLSHEPAGSLMLPNPGHTALVQLPGAVVVASLAEPEESPEAQLQSDSGSSTLPFQDSIYFREEAHVHITGSALETTSRKDQQCSALLFVQNYGILQISARPPARDNDTGTHKVTARSKIEQATFFSTVPGNIIDFSVKSRYTFAQEEVENAAIDISRDILSSSYDHLENSTASMEDHLQERAAAVHTLMAHLRSDYPPFSFPVKWQLMWLAERLAAAQQLWAWYQDKLIDQQVHPESYHENISLGRIIKAVGKSYKTPINEEAGETDWIRQYFLKDIPLINILITSSWQLLRLCYLNSDTKQRPATMQMMSEGIDILLVSLEGATDFRVKNCEHYGLDPANLEDGILKPDCGMDELPHFWTSSHNVLNATRSLIDVGRSMAVESFELGETEELAQKIALDLYRLVALGCRVHIERFQWALGQNDEKKREMGKSLKEEWDRRVRPNHIQGLVDVGLASDGMDLSEKYHDMPTLANLIWDESNFLEESRAGSESKMEQAEISVKMNKIKERIRRYFDNFGDAWAEAFYSKLVTENRSGLVFSKEYLNQPALTKFLRAKPARARLGWINEVCGEKNYEAAAAALEVASRQETNAWCSKVELSIAKLALLCKQEKKPGASSEPEQLEEKTRAEKIRDARSIAIEQQLEYSRMQGSIRDTFLLFTEDALDNESAVQLLMDEFGGRLKERPALQALLRQGFDNLVHNRVMEPALMIDVLTLVTAKDGESGQNVLEPSEFCMALRVIVICWDSIHKNSRNGLLNLIWKRLCIRDDWENINNTLDISDVELHDSLVTSALGWAFKGLLKSIEQDPLSRLAWPKKPSELLGAGCTNGELCCRFGSEDLRNPIINDNLADDEILQTHIEKHRLEEWFEAGCAAGKREYEDEKTRPADEDVDEAADFDYDLEDDSVSVEGDSPDEDEAIADTIEINGVQDATGEDDDVEMQDQ
ncbi:Non-repetitive/WGA-negative nucleoporin C-terminal-domain-containing protein [Massariosphaeria phaeospora]|uniref:Non-repetitive/WGA-negative nucleoporin C-terminal-domain-containing protein n=1 Tax=Massariosphaeria phaeospora TaxID=100035 RepID=A0A7C8ICI5_9PLEO|nr:Non-repetitive/WGA-negative nucleoporin C-terminal-domain-containing protein [Massariosphaeria phaeospora]